MKKVYYQLKMYQKSPLRISSGGNEVTDSDLMIDGRGCPFIPGSSIAGVLRDLYLNTIPLISEADADQLFGYISGETLSESHVIVSDGTGPKGADPSDYMITVRDGIHLDEWGITVPGNKYDFQVTETAKPYYSVLEWTGEEEEYQKEISEGLDLLMQSIVFEGISFGARTTRGYGNMSVAVKKVIFNFPNEIRDWLQFDPFDETSFAERGNDITAMHQDDVFIKIHADIKIEGSFSVRVNTARAERLGDGSVPDSVPLCNSKRKPVIPGTSWAGVFRHHMLGLLRQLDVDGKQEKIIELNHLFGIEPDEGEHIRSAIRFNETAIDGGAPYSLTRNAVDRFTQAPRNAALFTTRLWQGGTGALEVKVERGKLNKLQAQLLAIALIDMGLGLLSFGGAAGTGHGRCSITGISVNGKDVIEQMEKKGSHFLEEFL